ncbi:hypothetical protein BBF96_03815 [Anoxybacter fermentans]|uniref:Threonine/serine exporter-like N-terminal domain-containing protein n=1 Tax=Anoxybacter fermentans TaxID=1323375 RepID=A0A3S9SWD6_9FIRM|nr:threonine/serine exporter family protein [Anoxybacter fermentans]AZR72588.1 hypothetical protein BBF96_03815 [Anoxybacter fermentans]
MLTPKQILDIASYAGEIILANGAEIYRTEDTIIRICQAYGIKYVQSLVTPTGIFISIDDGDNISETVVRRIHRRCVNLTKISQVNEFSRKLQKNPMDYATAMKELEKISNDKNEYSLTAVILWISLGSSMNVILMKKSYINIIPALLASLGAQLVVKIDFLKDVNFVPEIVAGFIAGLISLFCYQYGLGDHLSTIIVSSILPFVPGVSLTNAIRDAINGDLISANSRGMEAGLIAISLAIGVALALGVFYT